MTKDDTTIVEGAGSDDDVKGRIAQIKREIDNTDSDWDREKLQERLAKLSGGVAVVKVGAATEVELKEKKHRIEDALSATRAAIEEGVVAGGGVALLRARPAIEEAIKKLDGRRGHRRTQRLAGRRGPGPAHRRQRRARRCRRRRADPAARPATSASTPPPATSRTCSRPASSTPPRSRVRRCRTRRRSPSLLLTTECLIADKPEPPAADAGHAARRRHGWHGRHGRHGDDVDRFGAEPRRFGANGRAPFGATLSTSDRPSESDRSVDLLRRGHPAPGPGQAARVLDGVGDGRDATRPGDQQPEDGRAAGVARATRAARRHPDVTRTGRARSSSRGRPARRRATRRRGRSCRRNNASSPPTVCARSSPDGSARRRSSRPTGTVRPSAVLAPFYELDGELRVVLTRRSWGLRSHTGEVSFPGGRVRRGRDAP